MRTNRLTRILPWIFILYTLHLTLYTSVALCASKGAEPVAYWRFDEGGGGTAYDESANNNDGTLNAGTLGTNTAVGQMWTRQGKIGGALECDGTDDYVSMTRTTLLTGLTFEAWVKTTSTDSAAATAVNVAQPVVGDSPGQVYQTFGLHNGKIRYNHYVTNWTSPIDGAVSVNNGAWHHIAVTHNQSTGAVVIYVDGNQDATGNRAYNTTYTAFDRIGSTYQDADKFDGQIDDVRIYNYSRIADQILVDYNAGSAAHLGAGVDPNEGNPPVGYWTMDENTGTTAYDRSGNGNNGTLGAGTPAYRPTWAQGKNGPALYFDGTDDYVTTDSTINIGTSDFTAEAWVKSETPASDPRAIVGTVSGGGQTGFLLYTCYSGATVYFATWGVSTPSISANTQTNNDGKWHHIVGVRSGTTLAIYIDGKLDASTTATVVNIGSGTVSPRIGVMRVNPPSDTQHPFKGYIDDVKIYNYARTPAQIAYDYSRGAPVAHYKFDEGGGAIAHNEYSTADTGAAPVGWWRMDEGTGTSSADTSGNGNTGTLATAPATPTWSASSKIGPYALSFDGTDDYVLTGSKIWGFSDVKYTGSAWIKTSSVGLNTIFSLGSIGSYNDEFLLWIGWSAPGIVSVLNHKTAGNYTFLHSTSTVNDGAWHHVVAVINGSKDSLRLFIDGKEEFGSSGTAGSPTNISDVTRELRIGKRTTGEFFAGLIDDLRIYNYARTGEQIYNDYKTTHGTLVGDTKFVDGKIGKALYFDGTGDYVECGNDASLALGSNDFTIDYWAMQYSSKDGSMGISVQDANNSYTTTAVNIANPGSGKHGVYLANHGGWWTSTESITNSQWYHYTLVRNGTSMKFYINGIEKNSWTLSASDTFGGGTLVLGKYGPWYGNHYIDEFRIYRYARTAEQIMQDYNAGAATRLGAQSAGVADPWGGAMPVGHWKLDENTGVLAQDASGNGNNGTLKGSTSWANGKQGACVNFAGDNTSYILVPHSTSLVLTNAFTFEAWVNQPSASGGIIFNKENDYEWSCGNTIQWAIRNTSPGWTWIDTTVTVPLNTWTHFALVYDGSSVKTYKNSILSHTYSASGSLANSSATFRIGDRESGPQSFLGKLDDVRVYNYARTHAQIAWDYNQGKPVGHWRFDEGSGATAYDESDNNNDGTITIGATGTQATVASAWTNGATGKFGKCMSFDGTDDYVRVTQTLSTPITASCWVKLTDFTKTMNTFINSYPHTVLAISLNRTGTGNIYVYIGNGTSWVGEPGIISSSNMIVNQWHHVSYTCDGTTSRLYLDGVSVGSVNIVPSGWGSYYDFGGIVQGGEYLKGFMDDVRIYNYARTAEQIQQDYLNGAAARLGD